MSEPYVLAVFWRAAEGRAEEVAQRLASYALAVRGEPGNLAFLIHRSPDDPQDFFLYEQYRDEAAFLAHQQTEHYLTQNMAGLIPLLVRRDRIRFHLLPTGEDGDA